MNTYVIHDALPISVYHVWAPISLKNLMVKELPSSLEDRDMRGLSVRTYPSNYDSTRIMQKIRILDHPKNLIEFLRARLAIAQGLTGNNITTGPNKYFLLEDSLMGKRYVSLI